MRRSDRDELVEVLRGVPTLRGCTGKDLASVARLVDIISVPAGKVLTREGAFAREAFVIVEGEAEVCRDGVALATVGAGEFVGEMAALADQPRSATVTALTPMRLLVMTAQTFGAFFDQPGVGRRLARGLAERLSRLEQTSERPAVASSRSAAR